MYVCVCVCVRMVNMFMYVNMYMCESMYSHVSMQTFELLLVGMFYVFVRVCKSCVFLRECALV